MVLYNKYEPRKKNGKEQLSQWFWNVDLLYMNRSEVCQPW